MVFIGVKAVSMCYSDELQLFAAVMDSSSTAFSTQRVSTSVDGATWTRRNTPTDNNWQKVIWAAELSLFVCVGKAGSGNRIMTSADGIHWILRASPADSAWTGLCSSELGLVAVGTTSAIVYPSADRVMTMLL
jgi:hypothetical protein